MSSEESFVVMDYATLENMEVEYEEDAEGQMSSPGKSSSSSYLGFRLLMSRNSDGRREQMCLIAESRYSRPCSAPVSQEMYYKILKET